MARTESFRGTVRHTSISARAASTAAISGAVPEWCGSLPWSGRIVEWDRADVVVQTDRSSVAISGNVRRRRSHDRQANRWKTHRRELPLGLVSGADRQAGGLLELIDAHTGPPLPADSAGQSAARAFAVIRNDSAVVDDALGGNARITNLVSSATSPQSLAGFGEISHN